MPTAGWKFSNSASVRQRQHARLLCQADCIDISENPQALETRSLYIITKGTVCQWHENSIDMLSLTFRPKSFPRQGMRYRTSTFSLLLFVMSGVSLIWRNLKILCDFYSHLYSLWKLDLMKSFLTSSTIKVTPWTKGLNNSDIRCTNVLKSLKSVLKSLQSLKSHQNPA